MTGVDYTSTRTAARTSGIPRGTLLNRTRTGMSLEAAVAIGVRTQQEAHPRSEFRQQREAAGVARSTAYRRRAQGLPAGLVLHKTPLSKVEPLKRSLVILEAAAVGLSEDLARALSPDVRDALRRWAEMPLSERVLWVLRGGARTSRELEGLLGEGHRRMGNVLSGLRNRGLARPGRSTQKSGGYGPTVVKLWKVTRKGATT